jgi:shikimate kinase
LKSSSSACNAIVSAVSQFVSSEYKKKGFDDSEEGTLDMIRLGVNCAREAGVTITGAFDDACGCHLGGLVMTDNRTDMLIFHNDIEKHDVILLIPEAKIRKNALDVNAYRSIADASRELVNIVDNDWYSALTLNGALIARAAGIDDNVAKEALSLGALAAGVSGTGPAISIITEKNNASSLLRRLEYKGYNAIVTTTR